MAAFLMALMASCLSTGPFEAYQEANARPEVDKTRIQPQEYVQWSGDWMEFRIMEVRDRNIHDNLTFRFFVDYHRPGSKFVYLEFTLPPNPTASDPTVRAVNAPFRVDKSYFGTNPELEAHQVKVIISDRGFDNRPVDGGVNPAAVPAGAGTETIIWTINVP